MAHIATRRALAVAVTLLITMGTGLADDLSKDPRVKKGFEIAASQNISLDQNVPSQGLGSYLVTISSCNDCHTQPSYAPGGSPYLRQPKQVNLSNYLAGGNVFATPAGTFCSRNLTPQLSTGLPAGLTREQFIHSIKTGCDPQDENFNDSRTCGLLNVMPWPNFQNYRISEISAMYDYLSALPHTEIGAGASCTPDPQGALQ